MTHAFDPIWVCLKMRYTQKLANMCWKNGDRKKKDFGIPNLQTTSFSSFSALRSSHHEVDWKSGTSPKKVINSPPNRPGGSVWKHLSVTVPLSPSNFLAALLLSHSYHPMTGRWISVTVATTNVSWLQRTTRLPCGFIQKCKSTEYDQVIDRMQIHLKNHACFDIHTGLSKNRIPPNHPKSG